MDKSVWDPKPRSLKNWRGKSQTELNTIKMNEWRHRLMEKAVRAGGEWACRKCGEENWDILEYCGSCSAVKNSDVANWWCLMCGSVNKGGAGVVWCSECMTKRFMLKDLEKFYSPRTLKWYCPHCHARCDDSSHPSHCLCCDTVLRPDKRLWKCPDCALYNYTTTKECQCCGLPRHDLRTISNEIQMDTRPAEVYPERRPSLKGSFLSKGFKRMQQAIKVKSHHWILQVDAQ